MDKFAFIFHPHDVPSLGDWVLEEPNLKLKKRRTVERALRWLPPFRRDTVTGIKSLTGKEIEGEMILWSMVPEQILNMDSKFTVSKLIEAGKIAQDLGAKIVGLGAYAAWIGKKGVTLAKELDIPVTTGTSYTIVIVVDAMFEAAKSVGISVDKSRVAIIGATGTIGRVASQLIAQYVNQVNLVARNTYRLEQLSDIISDSNKTIATVKISTDIKDTLKNSDIIIIVTSTTTAIINLEDVQPGTVICDISLPHNVSKEDAQEREDILVMDGGVVLPPGNCDFHFNFGLAHGLAYACMAETMMLTLEGIFESYSIGGKITIKQVEKIDKIGKKHGFKLAAFKSFGHPVPQEKIEKIRKVVKNK